MKIQEIPAIENCMEIGKISRTHGNHGEVVINLRNTDLPDLTTFKYFFLGKQERIVPFFIKSITVRNNSAIILFEDIQTIEKAELYCGTKVYIETTDVVENNEPDDIVGFKIINFNDGQTIGVVENIISYSMNVLLEVLTSDDKLVLLPFAEELIKEWHEEEKTIVMEIPDGIFDV